MAKFRTTAGGNAHDSLEPLRTNFSKGSEIFAEGDLGLAMYVIESGEVEIRKKLADEDRALARLSKGDFFGEMCMLEEETPRSATAVARIAVEPTRMSEAGARIASITRTPSTFVPFVDPRSTTCTSSPRSRIGSA